MDSNFTCTWHSTTGRCTSAATCPQYDKAGRVWANLCAEHNIALEAAIAGADAKQMVAAWVRASGGPKKLAGSFSTATHEPTGEGL